MIMPLVNPSSKPRFRFEAFWANMPGFSDCVQEAWSRQVPNRHNPFKVLHTKLTRTSKALRARLEAPGRQPRGGFH
jgi:hypothetical protein